mgnify:CR=1 FL=1
MFEGLKEALGYVVELGNDAVRTEVVEIAGKTYARSGGGSLKRYDEADYAEPVTAATLTALSDYIENCHEEFLDRKMIIHVVSPTEVRLSWMPIASVRCCLRAMQSFQNLCSVVGTTRKAL